MAQDWFDPHFTVKTVSACVRLDNISKMHAFPVLALAYDMQEYSTFQSIDAVRMAKYEMLSSRMRLVYLAWHYRRTVYWTAHIDYKRTQIFHQQLRPTLIQGRVRIALLLILFHIVSITLTERAKSFAMFYKSTQVGGQTKHKLNATESKTCVHRVDLRVRLARASHRDEII